MHIILHLGVDHTRVLLKIQPRLVDLTDPNGVDYHLGGCGMPVSQGGYPFVGNMPIYREDACSLPSLARFVRMPVREDTCS